MNTENSKTNELHKFSLTLADKPNFKDPNKNMQFTNFKIPTPTWNDEFDLPDELYSISDIQECFQYITKKH